MAKFPKSEWQGKHTFGPDCSDKNASPWGFDTIEQGSVASAILDFLVNTWGDVFPEEGKTIADIVCNEFNFYMNNAGMAKFFADSWLFDCDSVCNPPLPLTPNPMASMVRMGNIENNKKNWVKKTFKTYQNENK